MFGDVRRDAKGRDGLFARIGRFLESQGLEPNPANYTLAYAALADPDGPLAKAVARLTEGGVRLNRRDVEELGGSLAPKTPDAANDREMEAEQAKADALVAETEAQVSGFARMVRDIHAETQGFSRDLAESAAVASRRRDPDDIARVAAAMLARVRDAEARLAQATSEADQLRSKLAEARDTARRDVLTGLPNRRAFDEGFAARDEAQGPYWLAVGDVDHFKRLNDSHGHPVGDRVLRAIGQTLSEACPDQLVARYGGEEFVLLLRAPDAEAAEAMADRARAEVAAKRFRTRDTDAPIGQMSVSIGLTAVQKGESVAAAFGRADRLLYLAKEGGRNRVTAG